MKKTSSKARALLVVLVVMLVIGSLAVVSFAAEKSASYDKKYGCIVPTDSKLEARKTKFAFYGDKATLYFMRISEGESNANFAIEIYSDKEYNNLIRSMSDEYGSKGNKPLSITWKFKNTPSGTYYGKCYTYISRDDGNVIDTDSVETFKIKIDRLSKKTVELNTIKNTEKGIKITWTPLATATKYKVLRKAEGETKWTSIVTLGKGAYTHTDETAKSGKTYKYTVKCYDSKYESLYNKKGLSITYLSTPKLVDVKGSGSFGYAKITWKAVSGARSYEIYRKGGSLNSSEWKKIATVKGKNTVSYVDKYAKRTDWYYTYTVKAVNGSYKSTFNTDGLDFNYILAPKLRQAYSYKNGIKIKWSDSSDVVTKYYVLRKTSSGWKKIGTTTKKYFTDTTAVSGKSYTYTVKGVSKTNSGAYNPKGIKESYLTMPKLGTVTFDSKNNAKVTWSTVDGASSYKIFRKINSAKEWKEIATVKGSKKKAYLDKVTKKSGYTYQYTVKAVNDSATSYYDKTGIKNMYLSVPTVELVNKVTTKSPVGIKLTWKTVKGAESYKVLRKSSSDSKWVTIAKNVTKETFYDNSVKSGYKYSYAVRAVNGSAISRYKDVKLIALSRPVMESVNITDAGTVLNWSEVKGADTYYIYRKAEGGEWTVIGSYSLNSFVDASKEAKKTPFYYTVVAEKKGYKSDSDTVGMKNFVEATEFTAEFVDATETEKPCIRVSWTLDAGVESVEIFKSIGDDRVSLGVFDTESGITQYNDFDIAMGTEYKYTIKVVKAGSLTTKKSVTEKYDYPPIEVVDFDVTPRYKEDGSYITVKFTKVDFAKKYEIYRKRSAKSEWEKIKTIKASEIEKSTGYYKDYEVDEEIRYYYTVKGVASDRDSLYNTSGKKAKILRPLEPATGIFAEKDVVKITDEKGDEVKKTVAVIHWDEVENAQSYVVLRKTSKSDWKTIGSVSKGENSFTDDTIKQGVKYTYTILAKAEGRAEAMNEAGVTFRWELPEESEDSQEAKK